MTETEAIEIALAALRKRGTSIGKGPVGATRDERHMEFGRNRKGWVVSLPLDVPESFEPNRIHVEVYEPDGAVNIPFIL